MAKMIKRMSLDDFAHGSVTERFNTEMAKIADNIKDPNTDPEKSRTLTLKLTFKPDKNRQGIKISIASSVSLADHLACEGMMLIGQDLRTGIIEMSEIDNPGNAISMAGDGITVKTEVLPTAPVPRSFDPDTGEIHEPSAQRQAPIDLRAAQ